MNFIFDWDGTLGGTKGKLTKEAVIALNKIENMGENIMIATGRHPFTIIKKLADHIKKISYIVGGNGSLIFDVKANKMIFNNSIPKNYVSEVVEYVRNLKSLLLYMDENGTWECHFSNKKIFRTLPDNDVAPRATDEDEKRLTKNITLLELRFMKRSSLIKHLDVLKMKYDGILSITTADLYYLDVMNNGVNKWTSIQWLLEKTNNLNRNIIFGDSMNDMQMIENADVGIAMKNGDKFLQKAADKIIGYSDEHAILRFIEELEKQPNMLEKIIGEK